MSDRRATKRRGPMTILRENRKAHQWLLAAILLSTLYVLSYGPAVWLMHRGELVRGAFHGVYGPIEFARRRFPQPIPAFIKWYIAMWEPHYS